MMNKTRLEAFTDAIIAIAATIMVLELKAPTDITISALAGQWPVFLAYIISFFLIYIVWYSHHNILKKANILSTKTYLLNGFWVFWLTLVPFVTKLIGQHPNETIPMFLYLLVQILWSITFHVMDNQILKDNPDAKKDMTTSNTMRAILYGGFAIELVFAFVMPLISLILVGIVTLIIAANMFLSGNQMKKTHNLSNK
jgi:uncharacterized membrane protein